jgi:hypothetical protein
VSGRGGRRRRKLLDDLKERRDTHILRRKLRSHIVESLLWERFGSVVRQTHK